MLKLHISLCFSHHFCVVTAQCLEFGSVSAQKPSCFEKIMFWLKIPCLKPQTQLQKVRSIKNTCFHSHSSNSSLLLGSHSRRLFFNVLENCTVEWLTRNLFWKLYHSWKIREFLMHFKAYLQWRWIYIYFVFSKKAACLHTSLNRYTHTFKLYFAY